MAGVVFILSFGTVAPVPTRGCLRVSLRRPTLPEWCQDRRGQDSGSAATVGTMGTRADVLGHGEGKHRAIAHRKGRLESDPMLIVVVQEENMDQRLLYLQDASTARRGIRSSGL